MNALNALAEGVFAALQATRVLREDANARELDVLARIEEALEAIGDDRRPLHCSGLICELTEAPEPHEDCGCSDCAEAACNAAPDWMGDV